MGPQAIGVAGIGARMTVPTNGSGVAERLDDGEVFLFLPLMQLVGHGRVGMIRLRLLRWISKGELRFGSLCAKVGWTLFPVLLANL